MAQHTDSGDNVEPFPAEVEPFAEAFRAAVTACNGFVYEGGDLEAQIRFIKWMRTHPQGARVLLSDFGRTADQETS